MKITNDIKPLTYLKSKAALLLDQINEYISAENTQNALTMLKK